MKALLNIPQNILGVRDVADLYIRAMEVSEAKNQHFIASADGQISMPEIAQLIKTRRPAID